MIDGLAFSLMLLCALRRLIFLVRKLACLFSLALAWGFLACVLCCSLVIYPLVSPYSSVSLFTAFAVVPSLADRAVI